MKKSNKKFWIILPCIVVAVAYVFWVTFLNINYGKTEVVTCRVGETISENAYQYKANDYTILTEEGFEKKYGVRIDDEMFKMYSDVKILTVNMEITQIDTRESLIYKFDISNLIAQLPTYSQGISFELFSLINSDTLSLNDTGDKIEVILPYIFVKDVFSDKTWDKFNEILLKVSFSGAENTKKEIILQG